MVAYFRRLSSRRSVGGRIRPVVAATTIPLAYTASIRYTGLSCMLCGMEQCNCPPVCNLIVEVLRGSCKERDTNHVIDRVVWDRVQIICATNIVLDRGAVSAIISR